MSQAELPELEKFPVSHHRPVPPPKRPPFSAAVHPPLWLCSNSGRRIHGTPQGVRRLHGRPVNKRPPQLLSWAWWKSTHRCSNGRHTSWKLSGPLASPPRQLFTRGTARQRRSLAHHLGVALLVECDQARSHRIARCVLKSAPLH